MISSCPSEVGTVEDEPEATGDSVPVMMLDKEEELDSDPDIAPRMLVYESTVSRRSMSRLGCSEGVVSCRCCLGNFGYCRRVIVHSCNVCNTLHTLDDIFMTIKLYIMPLLRVHDLLRAKRPNCHLTGHCRHEKSAIATLFASQYTFHSICTSGIVVLLHPYSSCSSRPARNTATGVQGRRTQIRRSIDVSVRPSLPRPTPSWLWCQHPHRRPHPLASASWLSVC